MTVGRFLLCFLPLIPLDGASLHAPHYAVTMPRDFGGQALPKWDHGHLLGFDFLNTTAFSYGRKGDLEFLTPVVIPDAARVMIRDVAASPLGGYAVVGTAVSPAGAAAALLVLLTPDGQINKIIRTSPVALKCIAYAPDGTLWAVAREYDQEFRELASHDMLRHYDASGALLGHAVSRQALSTGAREPAHAPHIAIAADRVGFYADGAGLWTEVSFGGAILGQWRLPSTADYRVRVDSVQFTAEGEVLFDAVYTYADHHKSHGLYQFNHEDSYLNLTQVQTTVVSESPVRLLGVDGPSLVLSRRLPELLWSAWAHTK
jgi:hypothetical protein